MALNVPAGIPAAGTLSLTIIPVDDVADISALTKAEATGSPALNTSCHLMGDGYGRTPEQAFTEARRACQSTSYRVAGEKSVSFDATRFVYDPQDPTADVSQVYAALTEGEEYYLVERFGISGKTELDTGDYYNAYHVRLDTKNELVPGGEGELQFEAHFSNLGDPVKGAQIVATPSGGA